MMEAQKFNIVRLQVVQALEPEQKVCAGSTGSDNVSFRMTHI